MMLAIATQGRAAIEVLFTAHTLPHPHTPSPANGHFPTAERAVSRRRKGGFLASKGH